MGDVVTFMWQIGDRQFDTPFEADEWAAGNIGGTYEVETIIWCASCCAWVRFLSQEAGCPWCGGHWTTMGNGEWHAFDGGDREKHRARLEAEAAREIQRAKELAKLKAWNEGRMIKGEV